MGFNEGCVGGSAYTDGLEHVDEAWEVGDAVVQCLDGGFEEVEGCAERRDAVGVCCEIA